MSNTITLPRAVAEMMFNALLDRIHGRYAATQEDEIALAALDAALAEPDAIAGAVEAEREAICSIVYGLCISDNNAQEIVDAIRARGTK